MKKKIALLLATVMLFGVTVGATVAWLTAESSEVVNTFTFGNIEIDLNETDVDGDNNTKANSYELIPGDTDIKDPKVTVKSDSEKCYVFVKVNETNNTFDTNKKVIEYTVDTVVLEDGVYKSGNWICVDEANNIYVYTAGTKEATPVDASEADVNTTSVLAAAYNGKHIRVNENLTEAHIAAMADPTANTYPIITFDAAAVQSENIEYSGAVSIAKDLFN